MGITRQVAAASRSLMTWGILSSAMSLLYLWTNWSFDGWKRKQMLSLLLFSCPPKT
jgi:hypothetical protein